MGTSTSAALRRQSIWLVAMLVIVGGLQLVGGLVLLARFDGYSRRLDVAQNAHQVMLQAMTDAETGIRGWQLTRETSYLQPYESGASAFPAAARRTDDAVGDRRTDRLLIVETAAADRWLDEYAAPLAATTPSTRADLNGIAHGKVLFDHYRTAHDATADALAATRGQTTARFRAWSSGLQICLVGLALLALLAALRLSVRTHRLLLAPLGHIQGVLTRIAGGDGAARADPGGPPEIRLLAGTLNRALDDNALAQQRLAAQERYLDQVLDVLNVAVVACDARGAVVRMNRTARDDIGSAPAPAHLSELNRVTEAGASGPSEHPLALALSGQNIRAREMTFNPPGRPPVAVMVDACPLLDEQGRIVGAVATRYDVSVLRAREAELTAFAGIVAHDLRAPLAAVAGFIELLAMDLEDADLGPVFGATVTRIHAGVDRMQQLIEDLLAYATARDAPLRLEQVDLARVVDDVVTERTGHLRQDPGCGRPEITAGPLPTLRADPSMIRQMMDNLIGNAIKYTRDNEPARVRITAEPVDGQWTEIQVADRGIGIPAAQRASVFTSFHRAHLGQSYSGTGLGLAICQRVVDRHGGTITLDENPLGGTRFHILLPMAPGQPTEDAPR
ncbi:ATP-binding protein [Micromonosporaceae bacterium Da 78-11]